MTPSTDMPRVGEVWAFGNLQGRRVTITEISVAAAGRWLVSGHGSRLDAGPSTQVYIHAPGLCQTLSAWRQLWVLVKR